MTSDAQKRADIKYKKQHTKQFCVRFFDSESELWERLQSQGNKQGYIKRLIREDIESDGDQGQCTSSK